MKKLLSLANDRANDLLVLSTWLLYTRDPAGRMVLRLGPAVLGLDARLNRKTRELKSGWPGRREAVVVLTDACG